MLFFIIIALVIKSCCSTVTKPISLKQSVCYMCKKILAIIEYQCFHPLIRTIILLFLIILFTNSNIYQDINWILYPLYTLIFSSAPPICIYFIAGNEKNKEDGLKLLTSQIKSWVVIFTVMSILISLSSIVLAHSEWWPTLIKILSSWISINRITYATLIILFLGCGVITNYIIYIISKFLLGSINQHKFNRNKL